MCICVFVCLCQLVRSCVMACSTFRIVCFSCPLLYAISFKKLTMLVNVSACLDHLAQLFDTVLLRLSSFTIL